MTYMSEIALPQVRGALLGAFALSFGLGQLFNAVGFQILAEVGSQAMDPVLPVTSLMAVRQAPQST